MNWGAVKTLASAFIHRSDMDWDALQALALDEINASLTVQENEKAATIALTPAAIAGWSSGALPADFSRMRAVMAGTAELDPIDIKGLIAQPQASRWYAVSGAKVWALQTSLDIVYSSRIATLAAAGDTNVLTDKYSGLLLYSLLCQAVHQTQDFDALQAHQARRDELLGEANMAYAMTLSAGAMARTPYAVVSN